MIRHREEDESNVNKYGDPEILVTETENVPCEIQQRDSEEPPAAGEVAVTEWTMWFPEDTVLDTTDQIELDGQLYELIGEPEQSVSLHDRWGFVEAVVARSGKVESS